MRRDDLERAKVAFASEGFIYRHSSGIDMFLDGPGAKARDAVRVLFACEPVRKDYPIVSPDVAESKPTPTFQVLELEPLLRMKLIAFRDKDRVHVRDFIDVGLIDATWVNRLPPELGARLQELLDTPDG